MLEDRANRVVHVIRIQNVKIMDADGRELYVGGDTYTHVVWQNNHTKTKYQHIT